jgi:hypothetical protein
MNCHVNDNSYRLKEEKSSNSTIESARERRQKQISTHNDGARIWFFIAFVFECLIRKTHLVGSARLLAYGLAKKEL